MTTNTQTQYQYFNLHTQGIGYLNGIRTVTPKKGAAFVSCRIAALVGDSKNPEYRFFDTNCVGKDTEKLVLRCQKAVEEGRKVLVGFKLSDLWIDEYVVQKDTKSHKKGDTAFALKARLLKISFIKIDGEIKYSSSEKSEAKTSEEAEA